MEDNEISTFSSKTAKVCLSKCSSQSSSRNPPVKRKYVKPQREPSPDADVQVCRINSRGREIALPRRYLLWATARKLTVSLQWVVYFLVARLLLTEFFFVFWGSVNMPSVLWHCWFGGRKGIRPVKNWAGGVVLAWLSVWSEVHTCIWPSWCHCYSLSLASVKSRLVCLSGTGLPG